MVVFILDDALSVWTNLGKHLLFVWLFVSSIKTGTRQIIRLEELFSVVRRSRRTTEDNPPRRIMRLVPVFILETNNQTNNKCLPKFVQTNNASSSIKTANSFFKLIFRYIFPASYISRDIETNLCQLLSQSSTLRAKRKEKSSAKREICG